MNNKEKDKRDADTFAARVIHEVALLPEKEIAALDAAEKINVKEEAARIRSMLLNTAADHGMNRLRNAQAAVAERDSSSNGAGAKILTFEDKRAKLKRLLAAHPDLTQAARQGRGMDEAEIDDYLADLAELGITESDDN
jgi:hypothetical protein